MFNKFDEVPTSPSVEAMGVTREMMRTKFNVPTGYHFKADEGRRSNTADLVDPNDIFTTARTHFGRHINNTEPLQAHHIVTHNGMEMTVAEAVMLGLIQRDANGNFIRAASKA